MRNKEPVKSGAVNEDSNYFNRAGWWMKKKILTFDIQWNMIWYDAMYLEMQPDKTVLCLVSQPLLLKLRKDEDWLVLGIHAETWKDT